MLCPFVTHTQDGKFYALYIPHSSPVYYLEKRGITYDESSFVTFLSPQHIRMSTNESFVVCL